MYVSTDPYLFLDFHKSFSNMVLSINIYEVLDGKMNKISIKTTESKKLVIFGGFLVGLTLITSLFLPYRKTGKTW